MLVDSHCHIDFPDFAEDRMGVLERAVLADVGHILCVSVNLSDFPEVLGLARKSEQISGSN